MTSAGARGETAAQMARVLQFSFDREGLHPAFAELIREMNGHGLPRDYRADPQHQAGAHRCTRGDGSVRYFGSMAWG